MTYFNFCRSCDTDFASTRAFDRHRVGGHAYTYAEGLELKSPREDGRRCLDVDEMGTAGMAPDSRERWTITADAERARRVFAQVA